MTKKRQPSSDIEYGIIFMYCECNQCVIFTDEDQRDIFFANGSFPDHVDFTLRKKFKAIILPNNRIMVKTDNEADKCFRRELEDTEMMMSDYIGN